MLNLNIHKPILYVSYLLQLFLNQTDLNNIQQSIYYLQVLILVDRKLYLMKYLT